MAGRKPEGHSSDGDTRRGPCSPRDRLVPSPTPPRQSGGDAAHTALLRSVSTRRARSLAGRVGPQLLSTGLGLREPKQLFAGVRVFPVSGSTATPMSGTRRAHSPGSRGQPSDKPSPREPEGRLGGVVVWCHHEQLPPVGG